MLFLPRDVRGVQLLPDRNAILGGSVSFLEKQTADLI